MTPAALARELAPLVADLLRPDIGRLFDAISPFIEQAEMQARYGCTGQTLLAMERRREIPTRVHGRWLRSEVIEWEQRK